MQDAKQRLPTRGRKVVVIAEGKRYWAVLLENGWNFGEQLPKKSKLINMFPNPTLARKVTHWEYKVTL